MKWCIVPWLQKVKKLPGMQCPVWFHVFLMVQLFGTFLQFMVTAVQNSDAMLDMWGHVWAKSMFGFLPEGAWKASTPKLVAILLWFLSTTQLILPLMSSARFPGSAISTFPTRNAHGARVTESAQIIIKQERQGQQQDETEFLEEGTGNERAFEPESFYFDFSTCWSKLVKGGLGLWGFHARSAHIVKVLQIGRLHVDSVTRAQRHFPILHSGFMRSSNSKKAWNPPLRDGSCDPLGNSRSSPDAMGAVSFSSCFASLLCI